VTSTDGSQDASTACPNVTSAHGGRACTGAQVVLTKAEYKSLRSQIATLKTGRGEHRKYLPRVFTEHGALMAASVLNSPKAVEMSILVVRAFVRLRQFLATHRQVAAKLDELERTVAAHDKHIVALFDAVRSLMATPEKPKRRIGFKS
jgi:hypothetical protein